MMVKISLAVLIVFCFLLKTEAQNNLPLYKSVNVPHEERIEDLIGRMTLDEKIAQLNQWTYGKNANPNNINDMMRDVRPEIGSLLYRSINPAYRNQIQRKAMEESRLGIPIIFGFDVIHGYRTIFPIPLAQACSWNTDLAKEASRIAAKESWLSGVDWTFSPMVDVARDPRWGRVAEGYGEDPYTNARFGVAAIEGYQGNDLAEKYTIAACLKHFVGYSMSEGGRDYQFTEISQQALWESFLVPFEAGVKAGAATLMSGFNDISSVPASANHYTLTEVLKDRWKHDGFVISDWGSVVQLMNQGVAKDRKEAGYKAFMAGVEMNMVDNVYIEELPGLVQEGKVPMSSIDEAVRRILRVKMRMGLFEQPYVDELSEAERYLLPEYLKVAEQLAAESMVLLKNDNSLLPIKPAVKNIAMIGPMVKNQRELMGSWEGMGLNENVVSIFDGMTKEFEGKATLHYALGCEFDGDNKAGFDEAVAAAQKSDVVLVFLGEKTRWSGENASRSTIALPAIQEQLVETLKKTGKPIVLILSSGRPLELVRLENMADAMLHIWQPGTVGGPAVASILSGRVNPSGRLAITFPLTTGQIPMYYNMRQSSRPTIGHYLDISKEPMYWFGHGLSYSNYHYGEIKLSAGQITKNDKLIAEVEVRNESEMDGQETLFWFISDPVCSISRPMKELKYFEKRTINAGESLIYSFEIEPLRDLGYVDNKGNRFVESGDFYIIVKDQKVKFELVE